MGKPDGIPEDVWDAAIKWAHDLRLWAANGNTMTKYADNDEYAFADTIARAILAERERCAEIAAKYPKVVPTWSRGSGPPGFGAERFPTQLEIAATIRKGGPR